MLWNMQWNIQWNIQWRSDATTQIILYQLKLFPKQKVVSLIFRHQLETGIIHETHDILIFQTNFLFLLFPAEHLTRKKLHWYWIAVFAQVLREKINDNLFLLFTLHQVVCQIKSLQKEKMAIYGGY